MSDVSDKVNLIIESIDSKEVISFDESFAISREVGKFIVNDESAIHWRRIIIHILNNRGKIDLSTRPLRIDLIEAVWFYPYLSKESFNLTSTDQQIRQAYHSSDSLDWITFHDEQKYLVEEIIHWKKNYIISAPTSFGKSLIIQEIISQASFKNIVIIQPTLALLDETRKSLSQYDEKYKIIIRTSQEIDATRGNILLLTAERVMEYSHRLPIIDLLIIDEFYKLSAKRDDERSDTLNNAFHMLLKNKWLKFVLLGPNINSISRWFWDKYNAIFYKTDYSLVDSRLINMWSQEFGVRWEKRERKETALFELLESLADEQSLIYCSSPSKARILAKKYMNYKISNWVEKNWNNYPLVERIEVNFWEWFLADSLEYGIAFHDWALQRHITGTIINYFNEERLSALFCTSTIIEWVNTSAKKCNHFR